MSYRKFGDKDLFVNTMRAYPHCKFTIFDSKVIYNNIPYQTGSKRYSGASRPKYGQAATNVRNVPTNSGSISLYEYNIDRPDFPGFSAVYTGDPAEQRFIPPELEVRGNANADPFTRPKGVPDTAMIYPWISKDSARSSFRTINGFEGTGETSYNNDFQYGSTLTGKYPLSASITRRLITTPSSSTPAGAGTFDDRYMALKNHMTYYSTLSEWYDIDPSVTLNMISVPSVFYGSKIKPGTVSLKWYLTGSLIGEVTDGNEDGVLKQTGPTGYTGVDRVVGVVFYEQGIMVLSGSWNLASPSIPLKADGSSDNPKWIYFGAGANDGVDLYGTNFNQASFEMSFKGTQDTQVVTMFTHAERGKVNYSNNPTFLEFGQEKLFFTSSHIYQENDQLKLKNFVSSSYAEHSASFERQVFVSRVGVYDKNKNLIGIATLANPVLKKEDEAISFKLRLDI